VSPAAAAESLDEPDWVEQWRILRVADDGFDTLLGQWRRWHWTPVEVDGRLKKRPAGATEGIIALAQMGIMPPAIHENALTALLEQIDAHCWLVSKDRAWRIIERDGDTLRLNSFGDIWEINMARAKWDDYVAKAAAALEGRRQ
jgi:hypothetical protein